MPKSQDIVQVVVSSVFEALSSVSSTIDSPKSSTNRDNPCGPLASLYLNSVAIHLELNKLGQNKLGTLFYDVLLEFSLTVFLF